MYLSMKTAANDKKKTCDEESKIHIAYFCVDSQFQSLYLFICVVAIKEFSRKKQKYLMT